MRPPIMPTTRAEDDPDAWDKFWADQKTFELWRRNELNREYRQKYYAQKTKERQIAKMKNLMYKYPDFARQFYEEELQSE